MRTNQNGMTLIEVLVALFVLVTGVLGAVAMQTTAKKGSFDALQRSLASSLAQDIVERMRNNDADATILEGYEGTYGGSAATEPTPACNSEANACTPAQLRAYDIYEWTELLRGADAKIGGNNAGGLINALGCITHANQIVTVTIVWDGKVDSSDGGGGTCGTSSASRRKIELTTYMF